MTFAEMVIEMVEGYVTAARRHALPTGSGRRLRESSVPTTAASDVRRCALQPCSDAVVTTYPIRGDRLPWEPVCRAHEEGLVSDWRAL